GGRTVLIDFGVSVLVQKWSLINPLEELVCGSPCYMAPEQAREQPRCIGEKTDVFALGAVLYHLLTGRPPYDGQERAAVLDQARQVAVTPPRTIRRDIPKRLERICQRALGKEPKQRDSTAVMEQELRRYLEGQHRPRARWAVPA